MISHNSTRIALHQNRAFLLRDPIVFLPQQAKGASNDITTTDGRQKLTGEEAKKIYEDIVCSDSRLTEDGEKKQTNGKKVGKVFTKFRRGSNSLTSRFSSSTKKRTKTSNKHTQALSVDDLFQLTQCGDVSELENALESGHCDVNTTDTHNWSLLMCASYAGHLPVVQLLLKHGAKWRNIRDRRGLSAIDLARMAGHYNIIEVLSSSKTSGHSQSSDSSVTGGRSSRKRHHLSLDEDYNNVFFCCVCGMEVKEDEKEHNLSTIHQFNSQFHSADIPYSIPQSNKGFQLMIKRGWNPENGLGPSEQGTLQPIKTVLKRDRHGLGSGKKQKPRVTHFTSFDKSAVQSSPIRTRSVTRSQREEQMITPRLSKRARQDALKKDKQWEVNMRRYLNADDNYNLFSN